MSTQRTTVTLAAARVGPTSYLLLHLLSPHKTCIFWCSCMCFVTNMQSQLWFLHKCPNPLLTTFGPETPQNVVRWAPRRTSFRVDFCFAWGNRLKRHKTCLVATQPKTGPKYIASNPDHGQQNQAISSNIHFQCTKYVFLYVFLCVS